MPKRTVLSAGAAPICGIGSKRVSASAFTRRSVGKLLKKLDFSNISGRPLHPKSDLAAQEAFKDSFAAKARAAIPPAYAGRPVEIWFQDEARVGQQGTVARLWARLTKGSIERRARWKGQTRESAAHGPGSSVTGGLPGPICSAPSASPAAPARRWLCPASMSTP